MTRPTTMAKRGKRAEVPQGRVSRDDAIALHQHLGKLLDDGMAPQFLVSALLTEAVLIGMRDPSIKLSMLAKTLIEQYEQRHGAAPLRPHKPTRKRRKP